MLGLVIGTALLALVEHTTLLAAQAASSVEHSRMTRLPVAMTLISLAHEALGVAAVAAVVLDLDGNLVTGFAAGLDATSTILRAEWNVSDAMPQGTRSRHAMQSSKREHIIDYHYFWFIISLDCMGSYGQHGISPMFACSYIPQHFAKLPIKKV
ncbi:hypothetical protein CFP56_041389 [Quercus suber]|uniref:Uncharacterized protein n=1 Tax=Quercus suber TaxID=58331 RepID=A0AAW0IVW0_QUESU